MYFHSAKLHFCSEKNKQNNKKGAAQAGLHLSYYLSYPQALPDGEGWEGLLLHKLLRTDDVAVLHLHEVNA